MENKVHARWEAAKAQPTPQIQAVARLNEDGQIETHSLEFEATEGTLHLLVLEKGEQSPSLEVLHCQSQFTKAFDLCNQLGAQNFFGALAAAMSDPGDGLQASTPIDNC